jgi:hypothetical protein
MKTIDGGRRVLKKEKTRTRLLQKEWLHTTRPPLRTWTEDYFLSFSSHPRWTPIINDMELLVPFLAGLDDFVDMNCVGWNDFVQGLDFFRQ